MKLNRKGVTLGLVALGLAGGLAGGGVALAATGSPNTAARAVAASPSENGHCGMTAGQNSPMAAAATYLGLDWTELRAQLQDGKSLADIAKAKGKSLSGLKDAMVAAMQRNLDANTRLSAEQKAQILARMKSHLDTMVTSTNPAGMGPGMGMGTGGHMDADDRMGSHLGPGMGHMGW